MWLSSPRIDLLQTNRPVCLIFSFALRFILASHKFTDTNTLLHATRASQYKDPVYVYSMLCAPTRTLLLSAKVQKIYHNSESDSLYEISCSRKLLFIGAPYRLSFVALASVRMRKAAILRAKQNVCCLCSASESGHVCFLMINLLSLRTHGDEKEKGR